jgi:hypothetical protein
LSWPVPELAPQNFALAQQGEPGLPKAPAAAQLFPEQLGGLQRPFSHVRPVQQSSSAEQPWPAS